MDNQSAPGGSPPPPNTITPADIEAEIASEHYFTGAEAADYAPSAVNIVSTPGALPESLAQLTFCVLVLRNGFVVSGESACVVIENFDAAKGRAAARANAVSKVWPLLGFRLRDAFDSIEKAKRERGLLDQVYGGQKA